MSAWDVADLADAEAAEAGAVPSPLAAWAEHTLPVSALWCGGGGAAALAASASADQAVSFYAAAAGALLRTVRLPSPLTALVIEPGEHAAYAGGEDGVIYEIDLVGGGGGGEGASTSSSFAELRGHSAPVSALAAPPALPVLLSGSLDGTVRVWDTRTRVPLRALTMPNRAPVAAMLALPPLLAGAAGSGRLGGGGGGKGGGGGASATATTTLPPLARPGAPHPRPWEGGVAAAGGGAAPFAGRVAASGLLRGVTPPAGATGVGGWDCCAGGGGGIAAPAVTAAAEGAPDDTSAAAIAALEARLAGALAEAGRWKDLHGELMVEAARGL